MRETTSPYWVWQHPPFDKTWAEVRAATGLSSEERRALLRGTPIEEPLPTMVLTEVTPGEHPDCLLYAGARVVSDRLAQVLVGEGGTIQLIAARMKGRRAKYQALNVLDHVDAIDPDASKISRSKEGIVRRIQKLALRPLPPGTPGVFRLAGLPFIWVITDSLKRNLEDNFQGAGLFTATDRFRG